MRKILYILTLWLVLGQAFVVAQDDASKSMKFKVLDGTADGHKFNQDQDGYYDGKSLPQGAEDPSGTNQPLLGNIDVYVVSRTFSDTVLMWQRTNRVDPEALYDDSLMMSQFYDYYDQYGYKLTRAADGSYDLKQAYDKANQIYKKFREFWEFWGDGPEDFELIIRHKGDTPAGSNIQNGAERHRVRDILKYYNDGTDDFRMCFLYYDGKVTGVETSYELTMKPRITKRVITFGKNMIFDEDFAVAGKETQRRLIDRYIEQCSFEEDYEHLLTRARNVFEPEEVPAYEAATERILQTHSVNDKTLDRLTTFVFPGREFEQSMRRRSGFDLSRDTMETFRMETERIFATSSHADQLQKVPTDSVTLRIDKNLLKNYLCNYPNTWWNTGYSFLPELPRDGGEGYDLGGDQEFYSFRVLRTEYEHVRDSVINKGKALQKDQEGFVPSFYSVYGDEDNYVEYLVYPYFQKALKSHDFERMVELERASILPPASADDETRRVRLYDKKYEKRFIDILLGSVETADRLYLTPDTLKLLNRVSWEMPNTDLYYHMMHVNYNQDFAHVVGWEEEVCPCYRTNDLRFMALSTSYAQPDCPPTINNGQKETYKPVSPTKDYSAVEKSARLEFDKGQSRVNAKLGNNTNELDSLRMLSHAIVSDETTRNRIDTIKVLGISSPEGTTWDRNMNLSRARANSVNDWVHRNCEGTNGSYPLSIDSVATWLDVADVIEEFEPDQKALADHIREVVGDDNPRNTMAHQRALGYSTGANPVIDRALARLRKVQVRFVYKAQREPSIESIYAMYKRGGDHSAYSAFTYYMLLKCDSVSNEEKCALAREVIARPGLKDDRFFRTKYKEGDRVQSEQWFDMIRPLAANILAIESIRKKEYDLSILSPYITDNQKINTTAFDYDENRPFKYINADFVVYNQLSMLLGKGDEESMSQADVYMQMFQSARVSKEFTEKYHPEMLTDLVRCYTQKAYIQDTLLANRVKKTSIVNFFVINLSLAHDRFIYTDGQIYQPYVKGLIKECMNKLPELMELDGYEAEKLYFEAVVEGRYADFIAEEEEKAGASFEEAAEIKAQHIQKAKEALLQLFEFNPDMIAFCQGNRYIRGIYSNVLYKNMEMDYFLEVVDKYINKHLE